MVQIKMNLQSNIKTLMKRDGWSNRRLAAAVGATHQQVDRWRHGEFPHIGYILRMMKVTGWKVEEMFEESKEEENA